MLDECFIIPTYERDNYVFCYLPHVEKTLNCLIENEILERKLSIVDQKPNCIHAIRVIVKENNYVRPITDCKHPLETLVNLHTNNVLNSFAFVKFDPILSEIERE